MMKRFFAMAALTMAMMPMAAQDTYENARLLGNDLNGTARYVGMGGAMEALGADISTISTNPAGIGLFRHSTFTFSGSWGTSVTSAGISVTDCSTEGSPGSTALLSSKREAPPSVMISTTRAQS